MDCEKFESTLIDELYGELDELTSAAAKRHVAGCARCAGLLGGLRATRRVAVLPMVDPPADLEDRILSAARDAQKVVPMTSRVSGALAWAGNWATRPQTAMAATFLLMVGVSALFLRSGTKNAAPSSATMTVTAEGAPAPAVAEPMALATSEAKVDPRAAAAAHGQPPPPPVALATAAPSPSLDEPAASGAASGVAANSLGNDGVDRLESAGSGLALAEKPKAIGQAYDGFAKRGSGGEIANADIPAAGAPAGPAGRYRTAPPAHASAPSQQAGQSQQGGLQGEGQKSPAEARGTAFDTAMSLYRSGNFSEAARAFDSIANQGDDAAALWAARSVRDGAGGCPVAMARFDQIASRTFGTQAGYDAMLEGGRCLKTMGVGEAARAHFARLLTVPEFASRAQVEIDSLPQAQAQYASRAHRASPVQAAPAQGAQQAPNAPPSKKVNASDKAAY